MKRPDVTGLILAGGQSLRFDRDKARAVLDGQTLIARAYGALEPLCAALLVSVDAPGRRYSLPGPARFIPDAEPRRGPLGGLLTCFGEVQTPLTLVLACDLPGVTTPVLERLLAVPRDLTDAVVASDGERLQPLCGLYRTDRARTAFEIQHEKGSFAVHAALRRMRVQPLPLPPDVLRNVNAPEDLSPGG